MADENTLGLALEQAIVSEIGHGKDFAPDEERAQRETARELVRQALAGGDVADPHIVDLKSFSSGNTAMLVAHLETSLSFVVKVDRSPALVAEANLLRRAATDPGLPAAMRDAFPRVFAVDDSPPVYGYLMENLSDHRTLRSTLDDPDEDRCTALIAGLWDALLEPTYRATRSTRVVPNVREDYFERARARLEVAVNAGLLPAPDVPLVVDDGLRTVEFGDGWGAPVARAATRLGQVEPPFSTFVHGDPNPENVLWRADGDVIRFRLIDPKDWWTGDYLFDVAKLVHYLLVTAPVERQGLSVDVAGNERNEISYDASRLEGHGSAQSALVERVTGFAEEMGDCPGWRTRLDLATAANLLGIAGPRLASGREQDRHLALIALGEGLKLLVSTCRSSGNDGAP